MFIIDFDDTLFNTQYYHQKRLEAMTELGVTPEIYWQTYKESRLDGGGKFVYDDEVHAEKISRQGFDYEEILLRFESLKNKVKEFLFSDAEVFLQDLKKLGQPMYLLSWGSENFQKTKKVEPSGIAEYFDNVFYTAEPKDFFLKRFLSEKENESVWFVNDKPEESKRLADNFPQLVPIMKISPVFSLEEYQAINFPYFETLNEIKEYVLGKI